MNIKIKMCNVKFLEIPHNVAKSYFQIFSNAAMCANFFVWTTIVG